MINMDKEADTLRKLNLKRLDQADIKHDAKELEFEPLTLIDHRRFDIMAKYIYGKFHENKFNSSWGYRLYEDHIWVFNKYDEDDDSGKKGIASFVNSFNRTLKSVKENGFDGTLSLLPINKDNVPIDGAHRLTAALLYNKKVKTIRLNASGVNYNHEFFKQKGLRTKWADAIAYEYCKLKKDTYVVLLFPKSLEKKQDVREVLSKHGSIYYEKDIKIVKEGPKNLMMQLYNNDYQDLSNVLSSFTNGVGTISVFVFETKNFEKLSRIHEELTRLYSNPVNSFYINETHNDTIRLTQMFLNENSIHFLNNAILGSFEKLRRNTNKYKQLLNDKTIDNECFCVISDSVLAAYGIRESLNLDFIHYGHNLLEECSDSDCLRSYNNELLTFKKSVDDIIFNPENHFYYEGIKFATLKTVKNIKKKQRTFKDKKGIHKINSLLSDCPGNKNKELLWYSFTKRMKITKLRIIAIKLKYKTFLKRLIKRRTIT
ncbi:hypothetical protein [Virgibacillus necropolis]|uniref:Uncharacterized protein n=1 Tax=Virgibacillus necropolis TaxID=163877 RepID=A0A221MEJ2_9BACI|nr:hypothetical protein [Virgibacillus necropolis]ASN05989.1 hypothetical protein CFK40_13665 [Virgibacillus necropolis]